VGEGDIIASLGHALQEAENPFNMRNNETGEFELVVGNRQLLSGFFIVVLLFAVAFAMGYVVGQNSPKSAKMASEGSGAVAPVSNAADSRPQPASPVAPVVMAAPPPVASASEPQPVDATPQPTTRAAQGSPPPATQPALSPQPAAPVEAPGLVAASDLPAGSFWQVIAVKAEVAEAMRQTLKAKGFQVSLTQGSSNLTRVLVGPYSDTSSMGKAKAELESAGFRPVRYKRD
jgi:cell division protein FtsN